MKDLTHYFTSPKEENTAPKPEPEDLAVSDEKNDCKVKNGKGKKRKINLSKRKSKKVDNKSNSNENTPTNETLKQSPEEIKSIETSGLLDKSHAERGKKRKLTQDSSTKKKKIKVGKSKNVSETDIEFKSSSCDNVKYDKQCLVEKICDELVMPKSDSPQKVIESICIESSNSCEELITISKKKKHKRKRLFFESDEDDNASVENKKTTPQDVKTDKSLNDEKSPPSSRNSLFSYFNKVDKETALKQKPEKIKVEVLIHLPPSDEKKPKQGKEKPNVMGKTKKNKRKSQLDDSDIIEVISSEEIVDENSSISVNSLTPMNEPKEFISINEDNKTVKPKPVNIASIFITKKLEKSESVEKKIVLTTDKTTSIDNEKTGMKDNKNQGKEQKAKKSKKSLKRIKKLNKPKENNSIVESNKGLNSTPSLTIEKTELDDNIVKIQNIETVEEKLKSVCHVNNTTPESENEPNDQDDDKNKNHFCHTDQTIIDKVIVQLNSAHIEYSEEEEELKAQKSLNNINGVVKPLSVTLKKDKVIVSTKEDNCAEDNTAASSPKTPNRTLKNTTVHQTPENSIIKGECDSKHKKYSGRKSGTINGYFTPKNEDKCCKQESESKRKKTGTPWVMKVRFGSGSKQLEESDDDSRDSPQEISKKSLEDEDGKVENDDEKDEDPIEDNGKEENPPVVVIDDDSPDQEKCVGRRKSLPRNVKLKFTAVEEKEAKVSSPKTESPKPPVKMWPFFQKGTPQKAKESPIDEAKQKAKLLFLESGVPEIIKRKVEHVKSEAVLGSPAPIPTVSHVLQAEIGCIEEAHSYCLPRHRSPSPPPLHPAWSPLISSTDPKEVDIPVFERAENKKVFLQQLKEEEPKLDVKAMYKTLKEYKSKAENDVWTDVYRPVKSTDMVGNTVEIKKLKSWLETLKNRRRREGSVSSGDDFENDDSEEEGDGCNNMAVISGPCGCGKTAAVYAIANELDCKVLEINASCNRSGKRILAEFSESTQSHQVERSQTINGLLEKQGSGKSRKKKKSKLSSESKSEKTSLLLVEDADLLFSECDEGFVSALGSLAASSKRPLILVTNAPTDPKGRPRTPHLDKFINSRLLLLEFSRPKATRISLWLRLVGLVEGVMMSAQQAGTLVAWAGGDLRRALLQLQLMVHSNNSEIKDNLTNTTLWWRWPNRYQLKYELPTQYLTEPEEQAAQPQTDKKALIKQLEAVAKTANSLVYLDVFSTHNGSNVHEEDPCPMAWHGRCQDGTALTEPALPAGGGSTTSTGHELACWLAQTVASDMQEGERQGQNSHEASWLKKLRDSEQLFLSGVSTTMHTNHPSISSDYMPFLRSIGRSEEVRLKVEKYSRRAKRIFNYLQGLGIDTQKWHCKFMYDSFS